LKIAIVFVKGREGQSRGRRGWRRRPHRGGVPVPVPKLKPSACASDCTIPWPTEGLDPEEVVAEAHHQRPQPRRQCSRKAAKKIQLYLTNFSWLWLLWLLLAFWSPERRAVNHMDTIKWKGTSNGNRQHASIVRAVWDRRKMLKSWNPRTQKICAAISTKTSIEC